MEDDALKAENERLRKGVRECAGTLVRWAVAAGGHTPSAIIAKRLRQLIGDEPPDIETGVPEDVEVS